MVKCNRCGLDIDDSFDICPNCGSELLETDDEKSPMKTVAGGVCSECGFEISDDCDFCPNCGNKLNEVVFKKCSECGSQIGENDLFCLTCGAKINYPKLCSNCGAPLDGDAEFCNECGKNLNEVKGDVVPGIEKSLEDVASQTSSILDRIIQFFKQLFGGNS